MKKPAIAKTMYFSLSGARNAGKVIKKIIKPYNLQIIRDVVAHSKRNGMLVRHEEVTVAGLVSDVKDFNRSKGWNALMKYCSGVLSQRCVVIPEDTDKQDDAD